MCYKHKFKQIKLKRQYLNWLKVLNCSSNLYKNLTYWQVQIKCKMDFNNKIAYNNQIRFKQEIILFYSQLPLKIKCHRIYKTMQIFKGMHFCKK